MYDDDEQINDRKITVGTALTVGAWITTGVMLLGVWITADPRLGFTATAILGIAGCLTVREIVVGQRDRLWNAFILGRDAAKDPGSVSRLRRRD